MPGLVLAILFGFNCLLFPCEAQISLPSRGDTFVFLPGKNVTIAWKLDVNISDLTVRSWAFQGGQTFAEIIRDGNVYKNPQYSPGPFTVEKSATLILKNVTIQYNGTYRFSILTRSNKLTESDVHVFVAVKPNVKFSCSNPYTINEGDDSTCVCRGEGGNPPANVTWYDKDGVQIGRTGKEELTLPLSNVSGTNRGNYMCRAQSHTLADNKSIEVKIRLNFKPNNTNIMFTPERAVFGESVVITCNSNGLPEPSYNITYNGAEVSANKTYTIDDVQYSHAGIYKCVATNKLGKDSASGNLTVIEKPNVTINCSSPVIVNEGDDFTCVCRSEGGNPPANVTWYDKDGKQMAKSFGENSLNLTDVSKQDIGTYKCVAQRYNLTDEELIEVKVTLHFKPYNTKITITPEKTEVDTSVNITCYSEGRPEPSYNITHNRIELSTGKPYTISKAKLSDDGTYECIAWNKLGRDSASANLTVEDKPSTSNDASSGIEWYIVAVILVSGIIIVILLSYIVWCSRRRWLRNRKPEQNPAAQTTEADTTYQALDLTKIDTEDNYQSLRNTKPQSNPEPQRTEVDTTYQALDLSKMNSEDNYQSLRNREPQSNPEPKTMEADTTYQELDLSKMNTEDSYQSLRMNAASNDAVNDDESTYTELSKTRDEENKYQSLT